LSTAVDTTRPSRADIEPAALDLVRRHGAQIMSCARRYAATPEDAEDAYQRGLEILLTKAPSTSADDLVPWLKTVVKHEAFALRKQREKHGLPTEDDDSAPAAHDTHEHVERLDQLQRGAEAMQRLKPQEVRCMLLLAEGHSYAEICEITGFSYTKVNRCLAEGRLSFQRRVEGIESGAECERLAPLISAAADGEAEAADMLALRRHMRNCLACRAALRDARSVPARVAALAPAGLVFVPHAPVTPDRVHALWNWLHERVASAAVRGQDLMEMAATHKTVAMAASAAALAGGGAATVHSVAGHHAPPPKQAAVVAPEPERPIRAKPVVAVTSTAPKTTHRKKRHEPQPQPAAPVRQASAPEPQPEPQPEPASPPPATRDPRPATPKNAEPEPKPATHEAPAASEGEFGP
jgi:RNA polymerase sigma factor (sigma-70 family)